MRGRRELDLLRSDAIGWDHAQGHADDPAELSGRAALAARYLGHVLARTGEPGGVRSWMRRHRLAEHASCFSFWAPEATVGALRRAVAAIDPRPRPELLRSLAAAQASQARIHAAHPVTWMFRAVDEAAWGRANGEPAGIGRPPAAVEADELAGYVRGFIAAADVVTTCTPVADDVAPAQDGRTWRGGVVLDHRPGAQCRIAIQLRLDPRVGDSAAATVLAGLLDGMDGLLHRWLRAERGLVYGTVAAARPQALVIGASLLREQLPAVVDELHRVIDEIDGGSLPPDAVDAAAARVQDSLYARLDDPFGALDNHRRRLAGHPCASRMAADVPAAARRLRNGRRLSDRHRRAIGYVGPVDDDIDALTGKLMGKLP